MGTVSTIDLLPEDIRDTLLTALRDPRCIQLDVTAKINALLEASGSAERVTKSAVNRYALKMKETGAKMAQAREVANMWIGKLGTEPQGQVGQLVIQVLQSLAFDLTLKLQDINLSEETMGDVVRQIKDLSLTAMRLEKAATDNVKREAEIRKQAVTEAAETASATAKKLGLTADTVERIHNEILGI